MQVTFDIGGIWDLLVLGKIPGGDDTATVIGISTVAYLAAKDPGHVFLPAAVWHDAAYTTGSTAQQTMSRYRVDREFLDKCLDIANSPTLHLSPAEQFRLGIEATELFHTLRKFGAAAWDNSETND